MNLQTKVTFIGGLFDGCQKSFPKQQIHNDVYLKIPYFLPSDLELYQESGGSIELEQRVEEYRVKEWIIPNGDQFFVAFKEKQYEREIRKH